MTQSLFSSYNTTPRIFFCIILFLIIQSVDFAYSLEVPPNVEIDTQNTALASNQYPNFELNKNQPYKKYLTQYIHESWGLKEGFPQSIIRDLEQTSDGALFIATTQGLVRFDGIGFKLYTPFNTPELKSKRIYSLLSDNSGTLWVGTMDGGITTFQGNKFQHIQNNPRLTNRELENLRVLCMEKDSDNNVWIGTDYGVFVWDNKKWHHINKKSGLLEERVSVMATAREGGMWLASANSVSKIKNFNVTATFEVEEDLKIKSISESISGGLWVGADNGLYKLTANKLQQETYLKRDDLVDINSLYQEKDGSLWVGSGVNGIFRINQDNVEHFSSKNGMPDEKISVILSDIESSIWIGTLGGGLSRLRDGNIVAWGKQEGLSNDNTFNIIEDSNKNILISTLGQGGLQKISPEGKLSSFFEKDGLQSNIVISLLQDRNNNLWASTLSGLNFFEKGIITKETSKSFFNDSPTRAMLEDQNGAIWIATPDGWFLYLQNKTIIKHPLSDKLPLVPSSIIQTRDGKVFIGTTKGSGGFYIVDKGNVSSFLTKQYPPIAVSSFLEEASGVIWIGTFANGLYKYENGILKNFDKKNGFVDDEICSILEDSKQRLWINTSNGIFCIGQDAMKSLENKKPFIYRHFDHEDGMKSLECAGGTQPNAWRSQNNHLWFATISGVVEIDPEKLKQNMYPPVVEVEKIMADETSFDITNKFDTISIPPGHRKLEIKYRATALIMANRVNFKYYLEGFENTWNDAYGRRTAYYTNLPPGKYYFQLKAINSDGMVSKSNPRITIIMLPHFYQTKWFYSLSIITLVTMLFSIIKFRFRQMKTREKELNSIVKARTQELEEKRSELLLKNHELESQNQALELSQQQLEDKNLELDHSRQELIIKNNELAHKNETLAKKNIEIQESKEALIQSHQQVERVFSALTDVLPNTLLDNKYKVEEKIGSGGFSVVYKGIHVVTKRAVAIKIFRPSTQNATDSNLKRFLLEGISASQINHPNAVFMFDSGVTDTGIAYLVMELLEGRTLADEIAEATILTPERCAEVIIPLCQVLDYAHSIGVVHRDIKPDNIFLHHAGKQEVLKLLDFGIAKMLTKDVAIEREQTSSGTFMGTLLYIAPEILLEQSYDGKVDVYSIGILLYKMLCGKTPFDDAGEGVVHLLSLHLWGKPPNMRELNPSITEDIEHVVLSALEKDPNNRPSAITLAKNFIMAINEHALLNLFINKETITKSNPSLKTSKEEQETVTLPSTNNEL